MNGNCKPLGLRKVFAFDVTAQELSGNLYALSYLKIKAYADSIIRPEVLAVEEVLDEDNNVVTPAVAYRAPIYGDEDLRNAVSDV